MSFRIPLINFSLFELSRRAFSGGKISFKGFVLLLGYYLQIIPMLPFAFLQFLLFENRIKKTIVSEDPVFILGHYRSGTTLLQKLMASDKRFGFLNYYDALFPNSNLIFGKKMLPVFQRMINFFRIKNPFFHNTIVQLSEPDEEDDYLMNKGSAYSAYWGFVFPKRWREWLNGSNQFADQKYVNGWKNEYLKLIKYLTFKNKGKQLVLKNPPSTERIGLLLQMFPHAKFISIRRNPYHMYYSIRNMWKNAILKYYSVQKISEEELDEIVFGHFEILLDDYEKNKSLIPDGNLVEITYEELKKDPLAVIRNIYSKIELPDFELTAGNLTEQLNKEKEYRNFQFDFDENTFNKIEAWWGKYIRQWNYSAPAVPREIKKNCETRPAVIWLTGLSGAGKTTIAGSLMKKFGEISISPVLLDGDDIRNSLRVNMFDEYSRKKHNLYVGYFASLFEKRGNIVIVSLISPYADIRDEVRTLCRNFIEVYVSTKIEICIKRDEKGIYQKAINGVIKDFTGISAPYFPPENPELVVDNGSLTLMESTEIIFNYYLSK